MSLRIRLMLFGAALPALLLVLSLGATGFVFDWMLHQSLDRALLGQGAVEAVSLFDRKDSPHLHLVDSPLSSKVREFAPEGAIYGPDGTLVMSYPENANVPPRLEPADYRTEPRLSSEEQEDGSGRRVLMLTVTSPEGQPHVLWLAASTKSHHMAVTTYWRVAAVTVFLSALVLLFFQSRSAGQLDSRISKLAQHMKRVSEGDLASRPDLDPMDDEIARLRHTIASTTQHLQSARESQDRLVANAAHELRTPLAAMKVNIDIALRRERSAEELSIALASTRIEVDRLSCLATSLLDSVVIQNTALELRTTDLVPLVEEALDLARSVAEERSIIVVSALPEKCLTRFAPGPIRQAIDNLLNNAVKHSPDGSRVDLELEQRTNPNSGKAAFELVISDLGPGVEPEERERIFEPFHRAMRAGDGAGLGLSIVKSIALLHGGSCHVEGRPDNQPGARFVLRIPAREITIADKISTG